MCNAIGIINLRRSDIEGISEYRPIGATNFMGRYCLVDFPLSNMANSDIEQIHVYIKDKPRSLIKHIGDGRIYNINTKRGYVRLLGGEKRIQNDAYNTDINAFVENMRYIEDANKEYVVIAPCNFIYLLDFNDLIADHQETGADVTIVYKAVDDAKTNFLNCDCMNLNTKKKVVSFEYNRGNYNERNISLETYVMKLDVFKKLVTDAQETSKFYTLQDIISDRIDRLDVRGFAYKGPAACINDLDSYYHANMWMKTPEIVRSFIDKRWPIYTNTNDSEPTKYGTEVIIQDSCIANGCQIEGTVINSVIGRGVTIGKGAVVKDCVVMSETYIGPGTHVETAIIDKHVRVERKLCIKPKANETLYIKKYDVI